jgi:predicted urease superfamily metal-dependent hydrolase
MEYKSIREMADEWGISKRRIQVLCSENRIEGAVRIGYLWAIPADANKPEDARIKSGKYRKNKNDDKS